MRSKKEQSPAGTATLQTVPTGDPAPLASLEAQELEGFCDRWRVQELALFGSILRDDFRPESDVDFLVTFSAEADWSLFDHVTMRDELAHLVGREVDLVNRSVIEQSRNRTRREAILDEAKTIYAQR